MSCVGQAHFHFLIFPKNVIQHISSKLSKKCCFLFGIGQHSYFFKGRLQKTDRIGYKGLSVCLKKGLVLGEAGEEGIREGTGVKAQKLSLFSIINVAI